MKRFTITFGVGEDAMGNKISNDELTAALKRIRERAARMAGGYTEQSTVGGWIGGDGRLIEEDSRRLIVVSDDEIGETLALFIGNALKQAAVMLETEQMQAQFVQTAQFGYATPVASQSYH